MKNLAKIPIVKPSQFDEYLFSNWKAPVYSFYEKFHIERIENYKTHLTLPTPPHRRSVYFFIFLTQGKVVRSKGLNQYEIEPNHLFFLPADQITVIDYVSDDATGYYCHFLPEIFNMMGIKIDIQKDFPFFQITNDPLLKVADDDRVIQLLQILENEYQKNQQERFELIPLYLFTLFSDLKLQVQSPKPSPKNASAYLTQRYKNALSEYVYEKKTVAEFAEYLSVSSNHLHKCVKATTGKSAHQLLEDMRILEAKVLLKQTTLSVSEIAFKVGKFDPSDFSRFFKSKTSLTPNQYRTNQI
jgi:AraC family transcriptional regulator, transcriptional activator of pobA